MTKNYSYQTSLPAYTDNISGKQIQQDKIVSIIRIKKETTLKELEELTGLPQSTISGRVNDGIEAKKLIYFGTIIYKNRLRKKIKIYAEEKQGELFE